MFNFFKRKTEEGVKKSRETFFRRLVVLFDRARLDEAVWDELEELLISADVGVDTTAKLLSALRERVKREKLEDGSQVREALKEEMVKLLQLDASPATATPGTLKVVLVVGVNGSGKTTSIAKLAHLYKKEGEKVLLAAADTFRAAAVEQLQLWGERAGVEVVAHKPGGDPGAVVYDALEAARGRGMGVVIIDTAGRLHTKFNLMEEMKKIKRVAARSEASAPQEVLLVLDATTGQNGLAQAKSFMEAVGVTGIFLAKLDGTAKGGITLAIADQLKLPIRYIGTGEGLEDITPFDARSFVEALCSP